VFVTFEDPFIGGSEIIKVEDTMDIGHIIANWRNFFSVFAFLWDLVLIVLG